MSEKDSTETSAPRRNPVMQMHHHAVLTRDMQATRDFYEGILGMPLVGTWVETIDPTTGGPNNYMHCFFGLQDGSALAFFQFEERYRPEPASPPEDPFEHHIAVGVGSVEEVDEVGDRLETAGFPVLRIHHGYCYSVYTKDPNGMNLELSSYVAGGPEILAEAAATADADMRRWLAGTRDGNNRWRAEVLAGKAAVEG